MRAQPLHSGHGGSDETMFRVAPFTERLPFRPAPSWYDAYWCQDPPARRERGSDRAPASSLYSLVQGFVVVWLEAMSGAPAAPVSDERAEQASSTHRPWLAGGR